jgi:hypothetical protein
MACAPWGTPEELALRPSPYDSAMVTVGDAQAKVCYSRPATRGRLVFGGLVPYDTLWRTGANEPTVVHVSARALIAGVPVQPGDYSIYTVPTLDGWSVVVNAATDQWGLTRDATGPGGNRFENAYTDEVRAQEVGRARIDTRPTTFAERLTAGFGSPSDSTVDLHVDWATIRLVIPIQFTQGT